MRINGPGNHPGSAVLAKGFQQIFPDHLPQFFGFQNDSIRSEAQELALDLIQASDPEGDFQAAVRELADLLALMPNLFTNPPCPAGRNSNLHRVKLIVHDLEAVAHEIIQVEVFGWGESLIGHVKHLDAIQDEHPYFVPEVAKADEIDSPIVEPDPVRVHLAECSFLPVEGVVNHFNPSMI